jgi:23S rRNA pseudouridine1911/1915/1917 synthase
MTQSERIPAALAGERLDRVVALITGLSRGAVADLVQGGHVRIDGQTASVRSRRLAEGDVVDVDVPANVEGDPCPPDPSVEMVVVHADEHVVVVDKPAGLVVHPGAGNRIGTLVQGLLARYPDMARAGDPARPGVVHRLDKGTSGLLVFARTPEAHASLSRQLAERTAARHYRALAWGHMEIGRGVVDAPLGRGGRDRTRMVVTGAGRPARTRFEVERHYADPVAVTLLGCRLETGRTHQIRVHLAAVGHPVVGDSRYGGSRTSFPVGRPFLHAEHLAFRHPASGDAIAFDSELPPDLEAVLARLR